MFVFILNSSNIRAVGMHLTIVQIAMQEMDLREYIYNVKFKINDQKTEHSHVCQSSIPLLNLN